MTPRAELEARFARIEAIENALGVLDWDCAVMMPAGASEGRGEQVAVLRGLAHDLVTAPDMADLLARASEEAETDPWARANLAEMRRAHARASVVPRDLVEAIARATMRCEMLWREARAKSDFAMVRDDLREVLNLRLRAAEALGAALGLSRHDAMLDGYDPGSRDEAIERNFAPLRRALPDLIGAALEARARRPEIRPLRGPFPVAAQQHVGARALGALGFDFTRGRFDVSLHPFCGGASNDVRVTTRYDEDDFQGSLMGLLHEGGHALYEQGRPERWLAQPVGSPRGTSMHESQSLLIERHAGLSPWFAQWLAPVLREAFGVDGPEWEPDNLHRAFVRVERSFIRVEADEITYPAHVLLRHDLERAMISGDLAVSDLPGAFNEKMKRLLGLDPPDDARGCLQDIHWYAGIFGYFPTYCLGAMTAAQLFDAALKASPEIPDHLAAGDFTPLRDWLRANVHALASSASTPEIIARATGGPLDTRFYLDHLRRRYVG